MAGISRPRPITATVALAVMLFALVAVTLPTSANDHDSQDPADADGETPDATDDAPATTPPEPTLSISVDIDQLAGSSWRRRSPVSTTIHGRELGATVEAEEIDARAATEAERSLADLGAERTPDGLVLTLPETILFEFDSSALIGDAEDTIDRVAELLAYYTDVDVEVRGHTDSQGSDDYNQELSETRAEVVRDALVAAGAPGGRLTAAGFGSSSPVAPNERPDGSDDPEGRQSNRRVEIVLREG